MPIFCLYLLTLFCCYLPTAPYQAIVVNATTSRPLAGVSVVDLSTQAGLVTDARGRFSLPGPTAHFRLRSLGFADLETSRPALPPNQTDTLRLLPQAILLSEVSVRPARTVVLSSLGSKIGKLRGTYLVPGTQFGILLRPQAGSLPAVVQQINVRLQANHVPVSGRLRVRLVAPERWSATTPSEHDLLPIAATYTAAELAALPNNLLTVDLSAYNIRLPSTGFFVLIEGLGTAVGETYVTDKLDGTSYVVVTATDLQNPATFRQTPVAEFPVISWAASVTDTETMTRLGYTKPWHFKRSDRDSKKTDNVDLSLTILAE